MTQGNGITVTHDATTNTYTVNSQAASGNNGSYNGITSVSWDNHELVFSRGTIVFENGKYVTVNQGEDIRIATTPHSALVNALTAPSRDFQENNKEEASGENTSMDVICIGNKSGNSDIISGEVKELVFRNGILTSIKHKKYVKIVSTISD